jgi:hypothetical protein
MHFLKRPTSNQVKLEAKRRRRHQVFRRRIIKMIMGKKMKKQKSMLKPKSKKMKSKI